MSDVFKNYPIGGAEEQQEFLALENVALSSVLSSTIVRSVIQLDSELEVEAQVKEFSDGMQTQEMYKVSSNRAAKTVTLEYRCSGWPSQFVLYQLAKQGRLYIKVTYMPHFSQVNKVIAEEMSKHTDLLENIWSDVRVRAMESTNVVELSTAEQPPTTREGQFEIKWSIRRAYVQRILNDGSILLDSRFKPVTVVELTKERIVLDQVESVSSAVDVILHLTNESEKNTYSNSNITFDINPRDFKWAEIPLHFIFYYDIQTRLHSPTTLRVFFVRQDLKNDKEITSVAGRRTV